MLVERIENYTGCTNGLQSTGMSISTAVPVASELSIATLPPWLSATRLTKGNPIPHPPLE